MREADASITALQPRGPGHPFVVYGDSCSGILGAPHESTFTAVNAVPRRLTPPRGFMCDTGYGVWSTLSAASPWGAERLNWPDRWSVGHGRGGAGDRPFLGGFLEVKVARF